MASIDSKKGLRLNLDSNLWKWLMGSVIIALVLINRSQGIHCDENNYLDMSLHAHVGDARTTSKSVVFYFFNFVFMRGIGPLLGSYRVFTLYLIYGLLNVGSLIWLSSSFVPSHSRDSFKRWAFFLICLLSPFFLFNSSQVMMETPILGLLALLFGSLLRVERKDSTGLKWLIFLCSALAVGIKTTAIFPVLILVLGFYRVGKKGIMPALGGIVFAILFYRVQVFFFKTPAGVYGSVSKDLDFARLVERLKETGRYLEMWLFYLWPPSLVFVFYRLFKDKLSKTVTVKDSVGRDPVYLRYGLMALLSLIATFLIQMHSLWTFVRYAYPCVWIGLICVTWIVVDTIVSRRGLICLMASLCIFNLNFWLPEKVPQILWPSSITDETVSNGYTVLGGVPIFRWIASGYFAQNNFTFYVPTHDALNDYLLRQFMRSATIDPRFFQEGDEGVFEGSAGPKGVLCRVYSPEGMKICQELCQKSRPIMQNTTQQMMKLYAPRTDIPLLTQTCF